MMRLIGLELKRVALMKYIVGIIITTIASFIFITSPLFILGSDELSLLYPNVAVFLDTSGIFIRLTCTIFVGILVANIITKEYERGTIANLFLFPIAKKKILMSKLSLVLLLAFILNFASQIILTVAMTIFVNQTQFVNGTISNQKLLEFLMASFILMIATIATSMTCLWVGLKTKSSTATIVTAVVIGLVVNGNLGATGNRLSSSVIAMVIFSLIGCGIVLFSIKNVNREAV